MVRSIPSTTRDRLTSLAHSTGIVVVVIVVVVVVAMVVGKLVVVCVVVVVSASMGIIVEVVTWVVVVVLLVSVDVVAVVPFAHVHCFNAPHCASLVLVPALVCTLPS